MATSPLLLLLVTLLLIGLCNRGVSLLFVISNYLEYLAMTADIIRLRRSQDKELPCLITQVVLKKQGFESIFAELVVSLRAIIKCWKIFAGIATR